MLGLSGARVKRAAKRSIISSGLEVSGLLTSLGLLKDARGQGAIFTLHRVRPQPATAFRPNDLLEVTPSFLDKALGTLAQAGYEFIALGEVPKRIANPSSRPFACLTLDDGYRDNAAFAAEIFTRHNAPFTIFLTSGFVDRSHSMWWETLETLLERADCIKFDFGSGMRTIPAVTWFHKQKAFDRIENYINNHDEREAIEQLDAEARRHGINPTALVADLTMDEHELKALAAANPLVSYGAHTISHRGISRLSLAEAETEISGSMQAVERLTGKPTRTFAYPYGDLRSFAQREQDTVKRLGIDVAVTTRPGTLTARNGSDVTALPRISLNGLYQKARYVRALASGIPFKLML